MYGQRAKRFPTSFPAAVDYLTAATDYGPPEVAREAAAHLLTTTQTYHAPEAWRRLLQTADPKKDQALIKQMLAWMHKFEAVHGPENTYATYIGNVLFAAGLKDEAQARWQRRRGHRRPRIRRGPCRRRADRQPTQG